MRERVKRTHTYTELLFVIFLRYGRGGGLKKQPRRALYELLSEPTHTSAERKKETRRRRRNTDPGRGASSPTLIYNSVQAASHNGELLRFAYYSRNASFSGERDDAILIIRVINGHFFILARGALYTSDVPFLRREPAVSALTSVPPFFPSLSSDRLV